MGWGNDFHQGLYDLKISNNHIDNNDYQIIYLALSGKICLIGAKQTLNTYLCVNHNDNVKREIMDNKGKTYAFFDDNSDKFYILTYNNNGFSIAYSTTESIDDYCNYDKIHSVEIITVLISVFLPGSVHTIQSPCFKICIVFIIIENPRKSHCRSPVPTCIRIEDPYETITRRL